ncbi:MAG: hypothetical protein ACE5R6_11550 [Candidatus Heimdallarchaeota archaeon]
MRLIKLIKDQKGRKKRLSGFLALGLLLFIGLWNATSPDYWEPPKSDTVNAVKVDTILAHQEAYEGFFITIVSRIRTIEQKSNITMLTFLGVNGALHVLVTHSLEGYRVYESVAIKGISYIVSRGYILVEEIIKIDHKGALGFSILGGGLFIYYFFSAFSLDSDLSLKRRR